MNCVIFINSVNEIIAIFGCELDSTQHSTRFVLLDRKLHVYNANIYIKHDFHMKVYLPQFHSRGIQPSACSGISKKKQNHHLGAEPGMVLFCSQGSLPTHPNGSWRWACKCDIYMCAFHHRHCYLHHTSYGVFTIRSPLNTSPVN